MLTIIGTIIILSKKNASNPVRLFIVTVLWPDVASHEPKNKKNDENVELIVPANDSQPMGSTESVGMETVETKHNVSSPFMICPQCGERALYYEENCNKCYSCGYSKCS